MKSPTQSSKFGIISKAFLPEVDVVRVPPYSDPGDKFLWLRIDDFTGTCWVMKGGVVVLGKIMDEDFIGTLVIGCVGIIEDVGGTMNDFLGTIDGVFVGTFVVDFIGT